MKSLQNLCHINLLTPNANYSGRTAPLTSKVAFYIFIQQIQVLNILNVVYTLRFFSSKCSLFHNSNLFSSCIIHILYTGCAKIKKKFRRQKVNYRCENLNSRLEIAEHGYRAMTFVRLISLTSTT